jgi:hypothetical protein
VVGWEGKLVVSDAVMPLNHSGLVDMRFSVLSEVFWSAWTVISVDVLSNAIVGGLKFNASNLVSCSSDFRNGVRSVSPLGLT